MATTANRVYTPHDEAVRLWWWNISNGETPDSVVVAGFADITVQVVSVTSSPTVIIEGTVVPGDQNGLATPVWQQLDDVDGDAMSYTAAAIETVKEAVYAIRPRVSSGTGSAIIYIMGNRPRR